MADNGWIKLYRQMLEWEWYLDDIVKVVFIHLLLKANHEDKKWQGSVIKRGQLISSYPHLSQQLSNRYHKISIQQVRTALGKLKSTGEITVKASNKFSVITINNYSTYQDDNRQSNRSITGKQQASNRQVTTNKNDKKDKNIRNIYTADAETFLKGYNEIWGTNYRSTSSWLSNFIKWRQVYSLDDILEATRKAKDNSFWKDKLDPDKLLRGHEDRIGQLLNSKKRSLLIN